MSDKIIGKEQILFNLEKEIKTLETQIKYSKLLDIKNRIVKMGLINGCRVRYIIPYVLTASVLAGGCKFLGYGYPFYKDTVEEYLHTKREIDSLGNVKYEEQYGEYDNVTFNKINYCTKWINDNGIYARYVLTYSLGILV